VTDAMKTVVAVALASIAFGVIVVGLADSDQGTPTVEERVSSLSSAIKCPFCNGESLEDSASGVAADYRELIKVRVEAGATDDEILAEFAANFGDSFILDGSTSSWSTVLWAIPGVVLIGGLFAIIGMRRASMAKESEVR
jgi:cytochrome c-type biogenesis protein CcmH